MSYVARNHPQQVGVRGARDDVDDRETAPEMFAALHRRYAFTVDAAASALNAKLPRYFDRETDGLAQSWEGERVWCNPPYSDIRPWVAKASAEAETADLIVMLLPANRTEQRWWQDLIEPYRDRPGTSLRIEFLRNRTRFIRADRGLVGGDVRPPFGCCLAIWSYAAATAATPAAGEPGE